MSEVLLMPINHESENSRHTELRVLLMTDADVFAGTERHLLDLSIALRESATHVAIACPDPSPLAERAKRDGVPLVPVGQPGKPKGGRSDLSTINRIRHAVRSREFDLVHVHNGRSALLAALAGAGRAVPMVMTQHFLSPARTRRHGLRSRISNNLHRWLDKRISRHIAISHAVRDASTSKLNLDRGHIDVVHNGIRMPEHSLRVQIGSDSQWIQAADPLIFCAARAEPEKDLPTLIEAMTLLRNSYPGARCAIAGTGRQTDMLRKHIFERQGEDSNVRLLGFREDVAALMHAADMFVLPSPAEPFGLVLLEAMALGKPVIACDCGGPREIVRSGETGLLIPPRSPQAMAEAIRRLINDRQLSWEMGRAGRARYEQQFTASCMAAEIANVYRTVLANA